MGAVNHSVIALASVVLMAAPLRAQVRATPNCRAGTAGPRGLSRHRVL